MTRDIENVDDDIIRIKRMVKQKLINDADIIEALDNPKLNPEEPDSYVGVNIYDYIRFPGTQTETKNYISFDVKVERLSYTNEHMKMQKLIFMVVCQEDVISTPYGMSRHDLLSYLVRDIFNYSNFAGTQWVLESDVPGLTDTQFSTRTLTYVQYITNSLQRGVKTNGFEFPRQRT